MANIERYDHANDDTSDIDGPLEKEQQQEWATPPATIPPPPPRVQPVSEYDMDWSCAHGWLREQAMSLDAPPGISYVSMLAAFSPGVPLCPRTGERGTIFAAITAPPGVGKSRTMERVMSTLILREGAVLNLNPGSEIGLQEDLALEPEEGAPKDAPPRRNDCLVHIDELTSLTSKLSIQNSNLAFMLTQLWGTDKYNTSKSKTKIHTNARISLLGGVPCHDQDEFAALFGSSMMGGLYDRFIVVPQAQRWDWDDNWEAKPVQRHPWPVTIPASAVTAFSNWGRTTEAAIRKADPNSRAATLVGRIVRNAKRVALISASANRESNMSDECVQAALKFAAWQLKVKTDFGASDSENDDAVAQALILKAFQKLMKKDEKRFGVEGAKLRWYLYSDLTTNANLYRSGTKLGPTIFSRCWQAMINLNLLEREPICDAEGEPKPNLFTKRVRLVQ